MDLPSVLSHDWSLGGDVKHELHAESAPLISLLILYKKTNKENKQKVKKMKTKRRAYFIVYVELLSKLMCSRPGIISFPHRNPNPMYWFWNIQYSYCFVQRGLPLNIIASKSRELWFWSTWLWRIRNKQI